MKFDNDLLIKGFISMDVGCFHLKPPPKKKRKKGNFHFPTQNVLNKQN